MTRVKRGPVAKNRRKKILKEAKGYFGSKHRLFKTAQEQVLKSGVYAYRDRKQKKRDFRKLWIIRINAACKENDISYSRFINGLKIANIDINRKMLSEIAITHPEEFKSLVEVSKKALNGEKIEIKKPSPKAEKKPVEKPVEEKVRDKKEAPKIEAKTENLKDKTLAELKAIAKEKALKGYSALKKSELISLIEKSK